MPAMRRWITEWRGPGASPKLTVMHARADVPIGPQLTALQALWTGLRGGQSDEYTWTIPLSVEVLDDATGTLTGEETAAGPNTGVGSGSADPTADAAQVLLRWRTSAIVGGRRLQGRSFWPGLTTSSIAAGNLSPITQGIFQGAVNTFVAADVGFTVWSRPKAGSDGVQADITSATVWSEMAVLRRRRG